MDRRPLAALKDANAEGGFPIRPVGGGMGIHDCQHGSPLFIGTVA